MKLVKADMLSKNAFAEMIDEYAVAGTPFLGITNPADFPYFVRTCIKHSMGVGLNKSISPYTRYFLINENGTIFAQGDVRHIETPRSTGFAGQIGYGTVPSHRRHGYGGMICTELLKKACELGFKSIIITCRDDNVASAKIIEAHGGIHLETKYSNADMCLMRRYRVFLNN